MYLHALFFALNKLKDSFILSGEVWTKKPSLTQPGEQRCRMTFEPR